MVFNLFHHRLTLSCISTLTTMHSTVMLIACHNRPDE